ncbi:MAG TPA: Ig-like domain-containing protein, partial [Candidatus Acidoferrales bacterium]|nr:Ig-like domain-containing protein [Candidatus Acidoferrales bacterium]
MKNFVRNKHGQFVVVAALIIAVLTIATIITVYEISLNTQTIAYKPVDEFLLGVTSDMNRALTVALSKDSTERITSQNITAADMIGQEFMGDWQQSVLAAYPNYGFKFNQPISTSFSCDWNRNPGYSSALTTYDFDVASYGFIGWTGQTIKYVQLHLLLVSRVDPTHTNLTFQLTQSVINTNVTVPISDIPDKPDSSTIKVGAYTAGETFNPNNTITSLIYHGDGIYSAVFNQTRDLTKGIRLDLMVPNDEIWVSATLGTGEGTTDQPITPILTTTPPAGVTVGQAFYDTAVLTNATIGAKGTVTYTLYSGTPGTGVQIGKSSTVNLTNNQVPNSALYSTYTAGAYYFMAYYSGDGNNNAVLGEPEEFTVVSMVIDPSKTNAMIQTTPPGSQIGLPSTSISVTAPLYTKTAYSVTLKDPAINGAMGISPDGYWLGQIPVKLTNGTASYETIAFCMNFNKDITLGSTHPSTLTAIEDNSTWRAAAYILSWINPVNNTEAAVEQVTLWRILDPTYQRPIWISEAIDNQAAAWASLASGKDVARQGDILKWTSPLNGNSSSISLTPGSSINFAGQLTQANGTPRANVKLQFNATLNYEGASGPLNVTYLTPSSTHTDSQGMFQVTVKVPKDTPLGTTIAVQALTKSNWPQNYIDLDNQYQDLVVAGPTLNLNLSSSLSGSVIVTYAATTGTPFVDKATLFNVTSNAAGTVTYTLFSGTYPTGSQIAVNQVQVTNGAVPNSDGFTVNAAGHYYFLAAYNGDINNNPVIGDPEPFVVAANLNLSTTPPAHAIAGLPLYDTAVLGGVTDDAAGTVTYTLFKGTYPTGTAIGTGTVTVTNGIVPNSTSFTVTTAGSYYFIAQYSGDSNNEPVNGGVEPFTVYMPTYSGIPIYF